MPRERAYLAADLAQAIRRAQAEGQSVSEQAMAAHVMPERVRSWLRGHSVRVDDPGLVRLGAQYGLPADQCTAGSFSASHAVRVSRPYQRAALRREGVTTTFRLTHSELEQVRALVGEHGSSVSDLIREALYETFGVGELAATSISAVAVVPVAGNTAASHAAHTGKQQGDVMPITPPKEFR